MSLGDDYVTLNELKAYIEPQLLSKTVSDDLLMSALQSATAEIETHCGRQFNNAGAVSSRLYASLGVDRVFVDDFHTTTGLVVEVEESHGAWTTWEADEFFLLPANGVRNGVAGWPYSHICANHHNGKSFPRAGELGDCQDLNVRVTANWGWASVPTPVRQAALIIAAETYQLKDAPFGVAGMDAFGTIRVRENRMAAAKLAPYVRGSLRVA